MEMLKVIQTLLGYSPWQLIHQNFPRSVTQTLLEFKSMFWMTIGVMKVNSDIGTDWNFAVCCKRKRFCLTQGEAQPANRYDRFVGVLTQSRSGGNVAEVEILPCSVCFVKASPSAFLQDALG